MLIKHGNGKSPRNIGFSAIIIYINGEFSIAMLECQRVNNPASERWMSIWAQNLKPENTLSTRYISRIYQNGRCLLAPIWWFLIFI